MADMETDAEPPGFREILSEIPDQLLKKDIQQLKFLCSDCIPIGKLEEMDVADILECLLETHIITSKNFDFLVECLIMIGSLDVAAQLMGGSDGFDRIRSNLDNFNSQAGLSRFRILLYHLATSLSTHEVKKISRYLTAKNVFPKSKMESCHSGFDFVSHLTTANLAIAGNLDKLIEIADRLDRKDLVEKINLYSGIRMPNDTAVQKRQGMTKLENYPMTAEPRGICLIINNETFESGVHRTGTARDCDALKKIFESFHFEVKVEGNLTRDEMEAELQKVASEDHSKYNCFVGCILTHGTENNVEGVDGKHLPCKNIIGPFISCKSLFGKPKLFFIQACQGKKFQTGSPDLEMDGGPNPFILKQPDFLMANSTVFGHYSIRSPEKGSWFIQTLCDVFSENATRCDVGEMLVMVNNIVSKKTGKVSGRPAVQVHEYQSGLRKKVYFLENRP